MSIGRFASYYRLLFSINVYARYAALTRRPLRTRTGTFYKIVKLHIRFVRSDGSTAGPDPPPSSPLQRRRFVVFNIPIFLRSSCVGCFFRRKAWRPQSAYSERTLMITWVFNISSCPTPSPRPLRVGHDEITAVTRFSVVARLSLTRLQQTRRICFTRPFRLGRFSKGNTVVDSTTAHACVFRLTASES